MVELGIVRKRKDKLELRLPEDKISPETFDRIYRWMNDEQPLVKRTGIVSLLKAANYLQIRELTNQIWDCLSHERDFGEHHALQVALDAYCWKDKNLHILMLQRIHYFFLSFVASVEYLALPLSSLSHVLSSNEIRVNSEAEVFYAAIRWLNHEWPSRRIHVEEVMQMIRLTNLPNELLVKMEAPVGDVSVDRITRMTKVHERIKKAGFDQIVMLYNDGSQVYGQIYEVFQVRELQSRGFICHNLAPYHQPDPNSNGNAFSYADFLNYLGVLQSQPLDALQVLGRLP
ncbi:kelch-like protein 17 [Drosophila ficusphila]|uniref:kelch-like protein 17 n=1 Tax=Drosophila ficusphila TaxID=30025 RepID=UPI001C89904B|nr:kelch-like protein 17 [Drosophila ficusphila]